MVDKKKVEVEEEVIEAPPPKPKTIKLVPVPGVYIQGIPTVPMECSPEQAEELLAYTPAAFKVAE